MSATILPAASDRPASCVPADVLRQLLAGVLSPEEEAAVTRHLENCPICERMALELSDDRATRDLLAAHRRAGAAPPTTTNDTQLDEIRKRMHVLGWFHGPSEPTSEAGSTQAALDGRTQAAGGATAGRTEPPPAPSVGKFEIVELLGGGGFGMVYLARDRTLNRQVALKLARGSVLADPDLKSRFVREAEALARLEHPGIVPVYEAGEHEGTCYLAVGYCAGPTLEQWLRGQPPQIKPKLAARIAVALAEAVQHAHAHGILHRDIKPSNILLDESPPVETSRHDLPFTPKLTDFGLAKIAEQTSQNTISGVVLGTLQYMATEQAAGLTEGIGPPTDVYALGAVLYEMLTGRPPFSGKTAIETLRRVLVEEPVRPRHEARQVPDDLDAIVMRCLDKSPTRRYATAADLAADLRRFLHGQPTVARPLSTRQRAVRWVQRNQALSTVLALGVLVLMLSAGLFAYDRRLASLRLAHEHEQAIVRYRDDVYMAGQQYWAGDVAQTARLLARQQPAPGHQDLRGIEWHYLWALTTHDTFAVAKAESDVYQVALSPDGKRVAAVSKDHHLYLLDSLSLARQAVIKVGPTEVNGVAWSPDGELLATADDDGMIRLWDAHSQVQLRHWKAHQKRAYCVVFFGGGSRLASCGEETTIRLWHVSGEPDGVLEGHTENVEAIALSPVEDLLASAGADDVAITWDLTTRAMKNRLTGHRDKLTCVAFSPDGKWLATGGQDCAIWLFRHADGRWRSHGYHLDGVQAVTFTSDGRLIAGDRAGAIRTYRLGEDFPNTAQQDALKQAEDHWLAHPGRVWSLAMLPGDGRFVSTGRDGVVRAWQPAHDPLRKWKTDNDPHISADFSRDAARLFLVREAAGIEMFDAATDMALPQKFHVTGRRWDSLAVLHGREQVAAASQTGDVVIWNWRSGNAVHQWKFGDQPIQRMAYSPASHLLALVAYAREDVIVIDANTGDQVAVLPAPSCTDCAFSPDGQRLAVDTLNQLAIYDLQSQRQLCLAQGHSSTINDIAYHPSGQFIATASSDRTVRLWTPDGEPVITLDGHVAPVMVVAFTPDGRSLLTGGDNGHLKIFHVPTRRELLDIPTSFKTIRRLAIAPDNRQIALTGDNWEAALIRIPKRGEE